MITYLERREPAHNRQRFYNIAVTLTLFGSWAMVREWGRIEQPGTVREAEFETEGEAHKVTKTGFNHDHKIRVLPLCGG